MNSDDPLVQRALALFAEHGSWEATRTKLLEEAAAMADEAIRLAQSVTTSPAKVVVVVQIPEDETAPAARHAAIQPSGANGPPTLRALRS